MTLLKQRGGPGRGQGRKAKPPEQKAKAFTFRFPPEVAAWLERQPNKTVAVVAAIRETFKNNPAG